MEHILILTLELTTLAVLSIALGSLIYDLIHYLRRTK